MAFKDIDTSSMGAQSSLSGEYKSNLAGILTGMSADGGENYGFEELGGLLETTVSVVGGEQILRNWQRLTEEVRERATEVAFDHAEELKTLSQAEVPFLTGNLHDAAYVEEEQGSLDRGPINFLVGYSSSKAPYNWDQHDNFDYKHAPGRKAKYLTDPAEVIRVKYPKDMSEELMATISATVKTFSSVPRLVKKR